MPLLKEEVLTELYSNNFELLFFLRNLGEVKAAGPLPMALLRPWKVVFCITSCNKYFMLQLLYVAMIIIFINAHVFYAQINNSELNRICCLY